MQNCDKEATNFYSDMWVLIYVCADHAKEVENKGIIVCSDPVMKVDCGYESH